MRDVWLSRILVTMPFHWALCTSARELDNVQEKLGLRGSLEFPRKNTFACTHKFENGDGDSTLVVCIRPEKRSLAHMHSLLVHESVHVWRHAKEVMGEDRPSEEFEAYALQHISFTLIRAYTRAVARRPTKNTKCP